MVPQVIVFVWEEGNGKVRKSEREW
jgi:hypothetical protein